MKPIIGRTTCLPFRHNGVNRSNQMAHDVFISYSAHDKPIADAVCAALEAERIRCWIAPRDVLPGIPYGEALIEAINGSCILILLVSSNSNQSPQVMREVERAVSKGIHILPFRIEEVHLCKELEYYISSPHWLDALTSPMEEHLARLARTAGMLLAREPHLEDPDPGEDAAHAGTTAPPATHAHPGSESMRGHEAAALGISAGPPPGLPGTVPSPISGSAPAPVMSTGNAFLRRLASAVIDGLILGVLWIIGVGILIAATGGQPHSDGVSKTAPNNLLVCAIGIIIVVGYCGGMLAARGQTLGKMATGLRVVGLDGANPSFWRAALRESVGKSVSGYALFMGFLWMLWDDKQQTWHDKMAHTQVELAQ
jgi:uncharacterized RDD family membrane protein YckC